MKTAKLPIKELEKLNGMVLELFKQPMMRENLETFATWMDTVSSIMDGEIKSFNLNEKMEKIKEEKLDEAKKLAEQKHEEYYKEELDKVMGDDTTNTGDDFVKAGEAIRKRLPTVEAITEETLEEVMKPFQNVLLEDFKSQEVEVPVIDVIYDTTYAGMANLMFHVSPAINLV